MDFERSIASPGDVSDEEWDRWTTQITITLGYVAPQHTGSPAGELRMRKRALRLAELKSLRGLARILEMSEDRGQFLISTSGRFGWTADLESWAQSGFRVRKDEFVILCGPIVSSDIEIDRQIALVPETTVRQLQGELGRDPWPAIVVVTLVSMMTRYQEGHVSLSPRLVADAANGEPGEAYDLLGRMGSGFPVERVRRAAAELPALPDLKATSYADPVAAHDTLGYQPYVDAVARVILHKNTATPLVMAVLGEWGKGKSSFMRFLRDRLESHGTQANQSGDPNLVPRAITVWFDAWRYNSEDRVLAALLETVAQEIQRRFGPVVWLGYRLRFAAEELFNWRVGYQLLMVFIAFVLVLPIAATAVYMFDTTPPAPEAPTQHLDSKEAHGETPKVQWTLESFVTNAFLQRTMLGFCIAVLFVAWRALRQLRLPLGLDLNRLYEEKDHSERLGYRAVFKEDFERRLKQLARMPSHSLRRVDADGRTRSAPTKSLFRRWGVREPGIGNRVVVFVDDLDRCRPDTIVEVLETIKITLDTPQMIFVLGMDEQYVRTGIYSRYREHIELQEKMYGQPSGTEGRVADTWPRRYLEKIIQLPFRLPEAKPENIEEMLTGLAPYDRSETGATTSSETRRAVKPSAQGPAMEHSTAIVPRQRPRTPALLEEVDTPDVNRAIVYAALRVATAHDANPRRIKAFVNRCRLGLYLLKSESPGDFDAEVADVLACFAKWELASISLKGDIDSDQLELDPRLVKLRECMFQPKDSKQVGAARPEIHSQKAVDDGRPWRD